jgi:hypothetical protein
MADLDVQREIRESRAMWDRIIAGYELQLSNSRFFLEALQTRCTHPWAAVVGEDLRQCPDCGKFLEGPLEPRPAPV